MKQIKKINEDNMDKVSGGISLKEGSSGYYAQYFYSGALDNGNALIKKDIIGPYETESEIELQIAVIYANIRIKTSTNDYYSYRLYYKDQSGTVSDKGVRVVVE